MYLDYSALEKSQGTVCYSSIMLDDIANTVSGHSTPHTGYTRTVDTIASPMSKCQSAYYSLVGNFIYEKNVC